jgi:hypothetical protein
MKTRLIAVTLITGWLLAGAASAQKASIRQFQLQDDETGSRFTFHSDGSYQYAGCGNNFELEGVGNVKISGCMVTFEAVNRFRLVQAEIDLCKRSGRASILLDDPTPLGPGGEPVHLTVIDSNMSNNTAGCK